MHRDHELTICTVSFHNARHLALNWELTRQFNQDAEQIHWIVAENTPGGGRDRLETSDSRFRVIPGAPPNKKVSYHHTEGLHRTLELVGTRFLLILDPDFYVVRGNWWEEVRAYMGKRNLAIFGSPWHPQHMDKYRYFPAIHCMFIDLSKVRLRDFDFRPWPGKSAATSPQQAPASWAARSWARLSLQHRRRESVDSGTRVFLRFSKDPSIRTECLVPVYRLSRSLFGRSSRPFRSRLIEFVLPDSLCYVPKRRGYFTDVGFRESGSWPSMPEEWEEFMWQGKPFGFHVRRNSNKELRDEDDELDSLGNVITSILADAARHVSTPR